MTGVKHTNKNCNHCGVDLVLDSNYEQHRLNRKDYICKECYSIYLDQNMYINGKYISRSHPLYKAGKFKTFEDLAFSSLPNYSDTKEGYVYILTNPAWDGWIKIGMALDAEDRCKGYQTSSPYRDYKLCYKRFFEDRKKAEQEAHKIVSKVSEKRSGEWFKVPKNNAKEAINSL